MEGICEIKDFNKIEENLFLSCQEVAESIETLTSLDIKYVLSVFNDNLCRMYESITYLKIDVDDWCMVDLLSHIPKSNKFIAEGQQSGKNVLVHCAMGISRSSSIVIAYIMNKYKMSYQSAHDLVRKGRSVISPNKGFAQQLKLYEELGFTLENAANHPKLRQYLVVRDIDSDHLWSQKIKNKIKTYYYNRDVFENMTKELKLGQTYLCAKCGHTLFNELHVIRNIDSSNEEVDPKMHCQWTYIEPQKWMTALNKDFDSMSELVINCLECGEQLIEFKQYFATYKCVCPLHTKMDPCLRFRISNEKYKIHPKE